MPAAEPPVGADMPHRRRAGDGALVPPPGHVGGDYPPALAHTRPPAQKGIPGQPRLLPAASRRLALGLSWRGSRRPRCQRSVRPPTPGGKLRPTPIGPIRPIGRIGPQRRPPRRGGRVPRVPAAEPPSVRISRTAAAPATAH